ncbi:MAG: hypothetical protein EBT13_10950 [Rhodobacteraceae bacterium]|nr:hypothetical protein [Paracoccaceae bacterium]
MNTNPNIQRERVMLMSLTPWHLNPRGSNLRGIAEFADVLRVEGIREDLHVFNRNGVRTIMQGHRRHAAAQLAGIGEVWVKDYGPLDDAEAMEVLVSLQNGTDPFDALELATAARTLVRLGRTSAEVAKVFHRSPDTVQLYLDLETLPHAVQEAVWKGKLSLELADLMRGIASKDKQEEALGMVLKCRLTGQPMGTAQARVFLQEAYLKPQRWQKQWSDLIGKLAKKLRAQFSWLIFVSWEEREEYVMSEAMPMTGLMRVDEYIDSELLQNPGEPMTWGQVANVYGVPVFAAPAMVTEAKHLVMVHAKAIRDADSTSEKPILRDKRKGSGKKPDRGADQAATDDASEKRADVDTQVGGKPEIEDHGVMVAATSIGGAEFDLDRFRAIFAALLRTPDVVRSDDLWKPLRHAAWAAFGKIAGVNLSNRLYQEREHDESMRRVGMRNAYLGVVAFMLHQAANLHEFEDELAEVEARLGIQR